MQTSNDAELITKAINGQDEAYTQLVDRYKAAVYYHCFAIVRDEDVAEDIAQDTFIAAYYALSKYNPKYRLATWLFKIGTNKCLNHIKKHRKEVEVDEKLFATVQSSQPEPHRLAEHQELYIAVAALPPKHRAAISLYYWQGLDYRETALAMNAPVNSVRVWLRRAKHELRKELS